MKMNKKTATMLEWAKAGNAQSINLNCREFRIYQLIPK